MKYRTCRKKPFLSAAAILKRLAWAERNERTDWKRVLFTDECCLKIGEVSGKEHCWREDGTAADIRTFSVQFRPGKAIHIWGAIRYGKKLPLVRFNLQPAFQKNKVKHKAETINAAVYAGQIMWGPLMRYVNQAKEEGVGLLVVEDGATVHWNGAAGHLRTLLPINTHLHPPLSPDLNPIERCWQLLKVKLTAEERHATRVDELWENVQRIWNDISQDIIDGFIMDMAKRREQVIENSGKQILG